MDVTEKPTLEEVVREHGPFVRMTLSRLGVDARSLPDVEQEVLRAVARGLPRFDPLLAKDPATALRAWLFGICARRAANHHRAESRRKETLREDEELDMAMSSAPTAEELLLETERKALLAELTDAIDSRQRAVLIAYEIEGIPMLEVAAAQSIPVNTARNCLRLARVALIQAAQRWTARERRDAARKHRQ